MKQQRHIGQLIFDDLKKRSEPKMTHFQSDLEADKRWIVENPGRPFIHFTRHTGTHLWELPAEEKLLRNATIPYLFGDSRPSEIYKGIVEAIDNEFRKSVVLCQVYDGRKLRQRSADEGLNDYREAFELAERGVRRRRQSRATATA